MPHRSLILGLAAVASLAACATPEPAVVTSEFTRAAPAPSRAKAAAPVAAAHDACKVRVAGVRDLRSDTRSMGSIAGRPIHAEDSQAWVGSSLQTLAQDGRIRLVDDAGSADVDIEVDLLKAYILTLTQVKAATVVVRVRYRHGAAPATEQTYRGARDSINWASGEGEARGALNDALGRAVDAVRGDLLGFCQAAQSAAAAPAQPK